ncbi:methyltransferase [Afifella sp. H1R]|uniref:tRNA1(Val) (adenine(37)-N6)-methyltransferase n=1 Tax=Afifella sp. H1R TaxID=2908841 RepID=UPI001F1AF013|nr:methyltransferase [Afifella sp. H1R]MCF1504453.1 methyltransferase [Afifella sp. H1R]
MSADERTVETHGFLGARIALVKPASGHRPGLDAALLQAAVSPQRKGVCVEFGCGTGAVALSVAARAAELEVVGVDSDEVAAHQAEEARRLPPNRAFAERVRFVAADVTEPQLGERLRPARVDLVLMNPPFYAACEVSASPDQRRRVAHQAEVDPLPRWIAAASSLLVRKGDIAIVHRADRLAAILKELAAHRFGSMKILPFHAHAGEAAGRVLVSARLEGKAPLVLGAGIVLHEADGAWTQAAGAILRGEADFGLL